MGTTQTTEPAKYIILPLLTIELFVTQAVQVHRMINLLSGEAAYSSSSNCQKREFEVDINAHLVHIVNKGHGKNLVRVYKK